MATSDTTSKTAAPSTPAAAPAASQAAGNPDALPSRGAVRGDMLGIKALMAAELDQLSDGHTDENSSPEGADDSANLDHFDDTAEAAEVPVEFEDPADEAPVAEEEAPASDAETPDESAPSSPETKPAPTAEEAAKAATPKHEGVQSRIDELTARAKGAEERETSLKEQLAAYRARDEGALTPDILDHVETPDDLAKTQQRFSALMSWAIKHPDGGKLGDRDYSPEEVRELHAEAQTLITEAIPARREYLAKRQEIDRYAVDFYPWLKDSTKGAGAMVANAIQQIPAIRRLPAYRMLAADSFVGQVLRQNNIQLTDSLLKRLIDETRKTAAKPGATAKPSGSAPAPRSAVQPPAAPGRAGVLPPRLAPRAAAAKAAGSHLRASSGSEDDLAASIASKL